MSNEPNPLEEELCIVDSGATNSILREIKYFQTLKKREGNILTIAGHDALIVTLPMGTQIMIEDALLYPESTRTLLNFRDIRKNGFHVETHEDSKDEYLLFTNRSIWQTNLRKDFFTPTWIVFHIHKTCKTYCLQNNFPRCRYIP